MRCGTCNAELIEGAQFCSSCGSPATAPASPPGAPAPAGGLPGYVAPGQQPYVQQPTKQGLSAYGVWSIICSIVAILVAPPVFGAIAIFLGYRAKKAGDQAGDALMIGGVVAIIVGMVLGAILYMSVIE